MNNQASMQLMDQLQIGVILLDEQGAILAWNAWMTRHSGFKPEDVANKQLQHVFPNLEQSRLVSSIQQALSFRLSSVVTPGLNTTPLPLYQKPRDRDLDQRMQQLVYITPLRSPPYACLVQIQDMTATVRRERRLRAQSTQLIETTYRDPLTGIGNRRKFDHDLKELFRQAQIKQTSMALLMIDVDEFKAFNDRFGHQKGDECLIMVANTLQDGLRQQGDSMSRYGGEEFALPLLGADRQSACAIAERLRLRIEGLRLQHPASRAASHITISIGLSTMLPTQDQQAQALVSQADVALYASKEHGRNRSMWFDQDNKEIKACC